MGRIAEGCGLLEESVQINGRLGLDANSSFWMISLGEAYLRAGRRAEALAVATSSLGFCRERGERGFEALALRLLGEIAATGDTPDLEAAGARHEDALALARRCGMRPLIARCQRSLADLRERMGDAAGAEALRGEAAAAFRKFEMAWPGP